MSSHYYMVLSFCNGSGYSEGPQETYMGELEFQQRWEFRRNEDDDLDSSFDDSKSSDGTLMKKHKLVPSLNSLRDDETSETSRLKQKDNENPGIGGQINVGKAKKRKTRNMSSNLKNAKTKKDSPEEVDLQTSAYDPAPLDDLKNFMESLLEDLKVTRESLLKWMMEEMQKLVADLRGKPDHRGEKFQLQQRKKSKKVQVQHENSQKESMQFRSSSNSEKSTRAEHLINFQETVLVQQQHNFQVKNKQHVLLQDEGNYNRQHQNDFKYGKRTQFCNDRSLVTFPTGINAAGSTNYFNLSGDQPGSGQVIELITSSKKKGDSLSIAAKPNLQTSCADQNNVQVQRHNNVVLAIEAQKSKGGSLKRSVKAKKTVDLSDHYRLPEDQEGNGQAIRTAAVASANVEKLGSSVVQNFLSSPFGQAPSSSMYLTLPTLLTETKVANHGLDASLCNYVLPRVAETKGGVNSERLNQMLEPSSNQGSFPVIPPEERIRSFALMGSRNMGSINQNSTPSSGIGTGFPPVPLHQGIDVGLSIPRQVNPQYHSQETSKPRGLKMNGGATKFPGGSYDLSEHIAADNHHSHPIPAYKSDGRLMSYQIPNLKDGHLFLR